MAYLFTACGTGGGGGGSVEDEFKSADLNVYIEPDEIDTGEEAQISVEISDVNSNGILLKIKYPTALSYRAGTAALEVHDVAIGLDPLKAVATSTDKYIVFVLPAAYFPESGSGKLTFVVRGSAAASDKFIEVDADVLDPAVEPSFDASSPQFTSQDEAKITVNGDSSSSSSGSSSSSSSA